MDEQTQNRLTYLSATYMEVLEGSSMILQVMEREFNKVGAGLHQRVKQRNNRILFHLKALRQLTSDDTYNHEHQAFESDWYKYDDFRKDAAYFARIACLIMDRTYDDNQFMNQIEEFIRTKAEKGIIPDSTTDQFRIR